jgi:peptide methionine sulfoxide reductase MsrA
VFVHDPEQRAAAEASRDQVQALLPAPVVTQIADAPMFWPAEDYHQQYLEKRGLASCHVSLAR